MKRLPFHLRLTVLVAVCVLRTACAQNNFTLDPLGGFGGNGDGSIRPDDAVYVTFFSGLSYEQRGMACDPATGNLVVVDPHAGQGGSANMQGSIFVVDGSTGAQLGTLSTNGISGGAWAASSVGIADDGVVYVCNQVTSSTNATTPFKIYRWGSTSSIADPTVAFSGALAPTQRYGATMDIRSSGTGTQIIIGSMLGQSGTNVVIFTTTDGLNFTPSVIACTNITGAFSTDGIAFGTNNTFWAKRNGGPLYFMGYDLAAKTATVLASFSTNMPGYVNLATLSADNVNHLLGAIESASGAERVWLFDITNPLRPPVPLSVRSFVPNNPNATAPLGNLDFGNGRLYAHVVNNGLLGNSVDSISTPLPVFDVDLPAVTRVAAGQTAHFQVVAYPSVISYQWQTNGVNLSGATSSFLDVPNVQLSDNGRQYSVTVGNFAGSSLSLTSVLSVFNPASLAHLDLLWSAAPDSTNYVSNGGSGAPNERNIAYSPVANQLFVVRRAGPFVAIYAINPTNGAVLYNLRTDGINGGTIPLHAIAVANDGAIYACNIQDNSVVPPSIKIYRWASAGPSIVPTLIFTGNPTPNVNTAGTRWGDTLAVRGSGASTQILLDNQDATSTLNRYVALITPDATLTTWSARGWAQQNQDASLLTGRSLQFGPDILPTTTFWQKRMPQSGGAPLVQSSFNTNDAGLVSPIVASSPSGGNSLSTNGPAGVDLGGSHLGAVVDYPVAQGNVGTIPTTLDLFDLTSIATPVLVNRYNFPVNQVPNSNPSAQILFATNSAMGKNMVFALNGNNGLNAYTFAFGDVLAPKFLLQPRNTRIIEGGSASLTTVVDQFGTGVGVQWQRNNTPIAGATSATLTVSGFATNAGTYTVVATNGTGSTTSQAVTVSIGTADSTYSLVSLWSRAGNTFGGGNYVSTNGGANTPNERGFGYNALSNQVLVVQKQGGTAAYQVHVVDGANGNYLYDLSTAGINASPGSEVAGANAIGLVDVVAADDGAIFACNSTPNGSGGSNAAPSKMFEVYRWPNSANGASLTPVFLGDPSGQGPTNNVRWGDQMAARNSGANTELLFDSNDGARAAILKPDGSGGFSNVFPIVTVSFNASIGRNTQFAPGTNFWQKRKGEPLQLTTYNTNTQSSTFVPYSSYPLSLGALAVDSSRSIAVGIDYAASIAKVVLYDISDPNAPMLVSSANFPGVGYANANFIGKVIISGTNVYALNGNNGMLAFSIQNPAGRPSLSITHAGSNVLVSWGINNVGWTLQSTPSLNPTSWGNINPPYPVVGANYVVTNAISSMTFYRLIQ